ncbi:MAG: metalloregulator ArsR/SmtB family transcription factor [Planctomycetes bacterium]|nr:metalloregulator ArsR/SmtB family transcription factor [Planctomycetota bacterium]
MIKMRSDDHGNAKTKSPENGLREDGRRTANRGDTEPLAGDARQVVEVLKLLADETRLRIIRQLRNQGETHVQAFCSLLGHQQPAVSHHLRLLRIAGLIDVRHNGRYNFYRMIPGRFENLLDVLETTIADSENTVN